MTPDSSILETTRAMKASEFKANCLRLVDEVAERGEEIVITKNGSPVAKLAPYRRKPKISFGRNRENIQILGDIVSPMPAEWFENADEEDLF